MVVSPLALFSYLQFLDLLTTLAFLSMGVQEANPLVNLVLRSSDHPFYGLLFVKTLSLAIGLYCWLAGRHTVLSKANLLFAVLIVWNLVSVLIADPQTS
jgi:hypothetical protein